MGALTRGRALSFLGAWRALLRRLSRAHLSAYQTLGHRGEARSTLVLLSRVWRLLLHAPRYLIHFPLPLVQTKSNAACGPGALRPMRPCWVHPCNFLAGGWRGLGDQRTLPPSPPWPRDPSRPALGRHRDPSRRSREAKAWLRHRGLWARPALRPLNGRLCSSPSAAESGPAGAATMGGPRCCALRQSAAPPPPLR